MMAAQRHRDRLIERLPAVSGRYSENVALDRITWFRAGGPAEVVFRPADEADLAQFLAAKPADVLVTVIGVASNLLVRDGGIDGVVVRLGRGFARIAAEGERVVAGAAALDVNVARVAAQAGIAGLEFLSGVPGTIGGALAMNAGAFDSDMSQVTVAARALDAEGKLRELDPADLGFSYRASAVPGDWVFTSATGCSPRRRSRDMPTTAPRSPRAWPRSPATAARHSRCARAPAAARSRTRRDSPPGS